MTNGRTTLLVVDDDDDFVEMLSMTLDAAGYHIVRGSDGSDALQLADGGDAALLICDVNMPEVDGFAVCRTLRDRQNTIPIILLTTRDSDIDEALGLQLGADDYLSKPFRSRVLLARIEALLRRDRMMREPVSNAGDHGPLRIDAVRLQVHYRGAHVPMTVTEFRLLEGFAARPGHVLSRNRLLELMRDDADTFVDDRMVDSYVRRLRRKLEAVTAEFGGIETVIGAGYRWRPDAL